MSDRFDPPPFMEQGSYGGVVNKVLDFLDKWASKNGRGPTDILQDGEYAETGVTWMKEYQTANNLIIDGGCGPETRVRMKEDGFDFAVEAKKTGDEVSSFVQPDGKKLYWAPHIVPVSSRQEAEDLVRRSRRGN